MVEAIAPKLDPPVELRRGRHGTPRLLQVVGVSLAVPHQVLPLAATLVAAGAEVDVACASGPEVAMLPEYGVGYQPIHFSRTLSVFRQTRALGELIRLLRRRRYDVVHLHGPIPAVLGRIAARVAGVRSIVHVRGTFFTDVPDHRLGRVVKWLYPRLERRLRPSTDALVVLTEDDGRLMREVCGYEADRVTVAGVGGCGIDLKVWDPDRFTEEERAERRRELGVPPDVPVIGFMGRFVRQKGILELIEAFRRLRQDGIAAHLIMVGGVHASERDHSADRVLRERIRAYGLGPHVSLPGFISPAAPVIRLVDVFVLPSHREGIAQAALEAGALGIPVVGAACRGLRSAVLDGETGLLVPIGDADALAGAIRTLLEDPARATKMGVTARARALREHGRRRFLRRMLELYNDVLSR